MYTVRQERNLSSHFFLFAESDGFKLELDCPHRQSVLPVSNPVVRFEELSEDDREDLFAQMNDLTKRIHTKFKILLDQVYGSLKAYSA